MTSRVFSLEAKSKLKSLVDEGMKVMTEVEALSGGLNDTIKAVAEELEVKPSILKKALRTAYKSSLGQTNADHDELNTILETVGRTL